MGAVVVAYKFAVAAVCMGKLAVVVRMKMDAVVVVAVARMKKDAVVVVAVVRTEKVVAEHTQQTVAVVAQAWTAVEHQTQSLADTARMHTGAAWRRAQQLLPSEPSLDEDVGKLRQPLNPDEELATNTRRDQPIIDDDYDYDVVAVVAVVADMTGMSHSTGC